MGFVTGFSRLRERVDTLATLETGEDSVGFGSATFDAGRLLSWFWDDVVVVTLSLPLSPAFLEGFDESEIRNLAFSAAERFGLDDILDDSCSVFIEARVFGRFSTSIADPCFFFVLADNEGEMFVVAL